MSITIRDKAIPRELYVSPECYRLVAVYLCGCGYGEVVAKRKDCPFCHMNLCATPNMGRTVKYDKSISIYVYNGFVIRIHYWHFVKANLYSRKLRHLAFYPPPITLFYNLV